MNKEILIEKIKRQPNKVRDYFWNYYYKKVKPVYGIKTEKSSKVNIVVSLTSYDKRLPILYPCINSLLHQTYKPDKIILYLANNLRREDIPDSILELEQYGLEILFREYDIKSHKKYYYAMQEYPESLIITVDDDLIYEKKLIQRLLESYERYPNCVHAKRVHRIVKRGTEIDCYNNWIFEEKSFKDPRYELFATSGAGTLFPPQCIDRRAFDLQDIIETCLNADDIWLKYMQLLKGTKVVYVPGKWCLPIQIRETMGEGLFTLNVYQNENDKYILAMEKKYNVSLKDFVK